MNQFSRMLLAGMLVAVTTCAPSYAHSLGAAVGDPKPVHSVTVLSPAQVEAVRTWVAQELIEFGRDDAFAQDAAAALTPDDLAVLAAYPKMMQPAGDLTAQQESLIWVILIIGGIVLLVIAGDGSVSINS